MAVLKPLEPMAKGTFYVSLFSVVTTVRGDHHITCQEHSSILERVDLKPRDSRVRPEDNTKCFKSRNFSLEQISYTNYMPGV